MQKQLWRYALALYAAALLGSCSSCPRPGEDFSTPAGAVRALQQALDTEDSLALYRTLSEGLKERADLGALGTDIALQHMLEEYPEIQYLEDGEIVAERRLDAHHALIEVEVGFLFFTRRVSFLVERRTLAELRREGSPAPIGVFLPAGERVGAFLQHHPEQPVIRAQLAEVPDLWEQLQLAEPPITSFQIVDVWKIHAIAVPEEGTPAPVAPATAEGVAP
ncbi:MAG: hypothetical protein JNM84_22360 [Planctomycetes bacterium]|nr:hypothetical protein [Planctomycetota bacterium]